MLPDFRVRQRDYLLEIARLLTQELDLAKLLQRILRVSIEMLAGQAGLIAVKARIRFQINRFVCSLFSIFIFSKLQCQQRCAL